MLELYQEVLKKLEHLEVQIQLVKETLEKASATYKPTEGMATAAKRALKWHEEGKPGGTIIGLTRANQLKNRENLSESVVLRMHSFFSRHEKSTKGGQGYKVGDDGYPSPGKIAWLLWGGDAGFTWSKNIVDKLQD